MTDLRNMLRPLLDAEQLSPGPSDDAVDMCWARIAADIERGVHPALDVPRPAPPRRSYLGLGLGILGAGIIASSLYFLRTSDDSPFLPKPAPLLVPKAILEAPRIEEPPSIVAAPAEIPAQPDSVTPEEIKKPASSSRARTGRGASRALTEPDTFAAQLRLLAQGQTALGRDDFAEALRIADLYRKTYPQGHFVEDGEALRALALCESKAGKGHAAAERFLRDHPRSIHASRVREACKLALD